MRLISLSLLIAALSIIVPTQAHADSISFNVQLKSSDPTLSTRLYRDANPSVYTSSKSYPGTSGTGPLEYETFKFTADGSAPNETITFNSPDNYSFLSVYLSSFDPKNLATNYLADAGQSGSGSFSFKLSPGQTFVLVANQTYVGYEPGLIGVTVTGASLASVAATPEPASLLLLLTGFACIAFLITRQRRTAVLAV